MVIDKATGKGCAWSIASKTITKKLVAEGIVGKQFAESFTNTDVIHFELLNLEGEYLLS